MAMRQANTMTETERLELIATVRRGNCPHLNRVNICAECLVKLEKALEAK